MKKKSQQIFEYTPDEIEKILKEHALSTLGTKGIPKVDVNIKIGTLNERYETPFPTYVLTGATVTIEE